MTDSSTHTDRRTVLKATGTALLGVSSAGCLESLPFTSSGVSDDVVLDPPEKYDRIADSDLPYPVHAESVPEVTLPAPLHDREVTTTEFVGERHSMFTFVFTRCSMACPVLTASLARVQAAVVSAGNADSFAFMPITFDPEHDTPARLRAYGSDRNVDRNVGNWWFLRPETNSRARDVVTDTFGVHYEYLDPDEREMDNMAFLHSNLVLLVNADGYVERSYTGEPPNPATVVEDAQTLQERW